MVFLSKEPLERERERERSWKEPRRYGKLTNGSEKCILSKRYIISAKSILIFINVVRVICINILTCLSLYEYFSQFTGL